VDIVATRFVNTLTQEPGSLRYLPVGTLETALQILGLDVARAWEERSIEGEEFLSEPGPREVLDLLITPYLNFFIYQVMLNAKASEQSARMVSMKNATENAEELIKDLTLEYNKLRQSNITKELLEISGGQAE